MKVNNTSELMEAIAEQMLGGDERALDDLAYQVEQWVQPKEELNAQLRLINAAIEMVCTS